MVINLNGVGPEVPKQPTGQLKPAPRLIPRDMRIQSKSDSLQLGASGQVDAKQAIQIVNERMIAQLRAVVAEARASLGLPEGEELDISAEATAGRIADFALGFFGQYAKNNQLEDTEEGRQQYSDFIGKAINQGIAEARDILGALQALNPEVEDKITSIADLIQQRLADFVANGISK